MQRYFVSPQQINAQTCRITGADVHHMQRVMRFTPGDKIICTDGKGRVVLAEISHMDSEQVHCCIVQHIGEGREMPLDVSIVQGLPKGDKMEWILQKGTELGASRFVPFSSARTVVHYEERKEHKKRQRWKKIIKEAAEQSQRDRLPVLDPIASLEQVVDMNADLKLVADERMSSPRTPEAESDQSFSSVSSPFVRALSSLQEGDHVLVVIGPEGGLSEEEVSYFQEKGFQAISLGKRILRTETAVTYILAAISFYFEQMGGR